MENNRLCYEIIKKIEKDVYKVRLDNENKDVAILKKSKEVERGEPKILKKLNAEGIDGVPLLLYYYTESSHYFDTQIVIQEYIGGYDLFDYLNVVFDKGDKLPENTILEIFRQLLEILKRVHSLGIVHRDIKLENVMYTPIFTINSNENKFKISIVDWGLALPYDSENFYRSGTKGYIAPEVFDGILDTKNDVWSLGVLFFSLYTNCMPYRFTEDEVEIYNVKNFNIRYHHSFLTQKAKDILKHIFVPLEKRYSCEDLLKLTN
jgi:serine/threonine protein kinase